MPWDASRFEIVEKSQPPKYISLYENIFLPFVVGAVVVVVCVVCLVILYPTIFFPSLFFFLVLLLLLLFSRLFASSAVFLLQSQYNYSTNQFFFFPESIELRSKPTAKVFDTCIIVYTSIGTYN